MIKFTYPVALSPVYAGAAMSTWSQTPGQSQPRWDMMNSPAQLGWALFLSATEFFMSATAELNSGYWSSGQ